MWRRVNVFLYLNLDWDPTWGGELQLWDSVVGDVRKTISPSANTLVIFSSSDNVSIGIRIFTVCNTINKKILRIGCMYCISVRLI